MRDFGSIQSPQSAYLLNLGLESLEVRMKRHCENAYKAAQFLKGHKNVTWVRCCEIEGDKDYELGKKYLPNGSCGVVSFVRFMDGLKLANIATHVAASKTMVLHPASHTHRQMNDEELRNAGVSPDLIRLSCGIENAEDIIADLKQALETI